MAITRIDSHIADSRDRQLSQYKRPNLDALVATMAQRVQDIEDALFSVYGCFDLATATGAQLDVVARLVGTSRYGLSDDQLRVLLVGVINLQNGNSTAETLVSVAKALFQTDQVFFADAGSGKHTPQVGRSTVTLGIGTTKLPAAAITLAKSLLGQAVGAGVRLLFVSSFESGQAFAMSGPQAWVQGYASVKTPQAGGRMAGTYV